MTRIVRGSIFDSKCDLLIIPCDSAGGVTQFVRDSLSSRGLPTEIGSIPFGDVLFRSVSYEYSSVIGYAASVDIETIKSNSETITKIGHKIAAYCAENEIESINIPLLGTGAGGMTPIDSYRALNKAFLLAKEKSKSFNIHCFTPEIFKNISPLPENDEDHLRITPPRVFISYTGTDDTNSSWARNLAAKLRSNGVNARIDVFHLRAGSDLPQWMTNEVILADKVILICERYYMEKANVRKGGVGWETMIIQGDMLTQGDNQSKYIAIMREKNPDEALPIYMKSKYALNWGNQLEIEESKFKELLHCIFDCDVAPEIGPIPSYIQESLQKKA